MNPNLGTPGYFRLFAQEICKRMATRQRENRDEIYWQAWAARLFPHLRSMYPAWISWDRLSNDDRVTSPTGRYSEAGYYFARALCRRACPVRFCYRDIPEKVDGIWRSQ